MGPNFGKQTCGELSGATNRPCRQVETTITKKPLEDINVPLSGKKRKNNQNPHFSNASMESNG